MGRDVVFWLKRGRTYTVKKLIIKLFPARVRLVSDIPAVEGKNAKLFLQCSSNNGTKAGGSMFHPKEGIGLSDQVIANLIPFLIIHIFFVSIFDRKYM